MPPAWIWSWRAWRRQWGRSLARAHRWFGTRASESDGELALAAETFADAAAGWHDFGVLHEEGHALLGEGRCLVALDRAPEAAAPLAAAREIFVRLGAKSALAETDGLVRQTESA